MEALTQMRCVACRKDAPTVTDAELAEFHRQVADWDIVELDGIKRLRRVFSVDDFAQALEFTKRVGELAEEEGHHPALLTEWGRTTVTWWTHKIRGLRPSRASRVAGLNPAAVALEVEAQPSTV